LAIRNWQFEFGQWWHNATVSRTYKDSSRAKGKTLVVVRKNDGLFDVLLNKKLERSDINEDGLAYELCVRFGFCGEEYKAILNEVELQGSATIVL